MNEQGVRVPGEISVTGYDDIEFAGVVTPSLTTVTQPMRAMGAAAARLLKQRIDEPGEPAHSVTSVPRLCGLPNPVRLLA